MTVRFKGAHFAKDILLTGVRWYVAYPLNTRHAEVHLPLITGLAQVRRIPDPVETAALQCQSPAVPA